MTMLMTKGKAALGALVVILAVLFWMLLSGPVLMKIRLNPLTRRANGTIFNPLRDRSHERAARKLLQGIHSQNCSSFLMTQPISSEQVEQICSRQAHDPLTDSCEMVDATQYKDSIWLSFQCQYQRGGESTSDVSVTLARNGLALQRYERIY